MNLEETIEQIRSWILERCDPFDVDLLGERVAIDLDGENNPLAGRTIVELRAIQRWRNR